MRRGAILLSLALLLLATGAWVALASPAALSLAWWTVDGGGQTALQGGEYTLGGTAGQPDAGVLSGGELTLGGGFWRGGVVAEVAYGIYLPLIVR